MRGYEILGIPYFVCLNCRRSVKASMGKMIRNGMYSWLGTCSICRGDLIWVGKRFTTPRKKDDAAWKKLEWMIRNGWRGYGWPTHPKMNLREVQESLALQSRESAKRDQEIKQNKSLEEQRRAAKYNSSLSKTGKRRLKSEVRRQEKYQNSVLESVAKKN